ncbi:MAG: DNA repair protein RadA [Deltaproteobacteria bacterium]|nr:DNA repair protein RadA [Deltaproteobacteria bacterium]
MAKAQHIYVCQRCGHQMGKWHGRCPACEQYGSVVEEVVRAPAKGGRGRGGFSRADSTPIAIDDLEARATPRLATGCAELDRVLGGGVVPGSFVLLGGDPGIGKSTILLSACHRLLAAGAASLYVTAEESLAQIKLRADRLGVRGRELRVVAETDLERIVAHAEALRPAVLVVDSIQTVFCPELESAPGSVAQVREAAARLMYLAKGTGIATFVIGHVTKEGAIAGPRVLEHMVDTVLYFEGDPAGAYRILRAHKNRFGSTNEIGVFEMRGEGLVEVANPSAQLLAERPESASGSVVVPALEGTRPLLVEVQGLVSHSALAMPRRTALGVDPQRVALIAAIAERSVGIDLAGQDVYVNVAGGVRLNDPAADLGVALALISSARRRPIAATTVVFGELGLLGEIRAVAQAELRLGEAAKLGFGEALLPARASEGVRVAGIALRPVQRLDQACELVFEG